MYRGRLKYGNHPTYVGDIRFDSTKEAQYYVYLRDLQTKGEIKDLRLQVHFELVPGIYETRYKHFKRKADEPYQYTVQEPIEYVADFVYTAVTTGKEMVVDVKSEITRKDKVYILKKKMMRALHGIEITEV